MTAAIVDTNVLIYAADQSAGDKHCRALDLLRALAEVRVAVSTQVLSEYANVSIHPHKFAISASRVADLVRDVELFYEVLPVTEDTVIAALEACDCWQLSYYDAQIWAAAALAGVPVVLSEDFSDGLELGGVRFVDPFTEGFDVVEFAANL